jgi:1,2-diacylglycerol 3-beta-galactosyltransferase
MQQALALGHDPSRVFRTSGMILRPEFYEAQTSDRATERQQLGLAANVPTGLVLFGGEGSNVMLPIAERLGNSPLDLQLILICGRNEELRGRLGKLETHNKLFIEGFTKNIPFYMHLSDFFIGKPGPGSISESVQMRLPVIVERNSWTLPQERYNADWVREQGAGIVLQNFRGIEVAVKDLLAGDRLPAMRQKLAAMNNRAVYEIPPLLAKILANPPVTM